MEELVRAIVEPIVVNKEALMIKIVATEEDDISDIIIISNKDDTARLIGKGGAIASAIRKVISVKSKLDNTHFRVKFESYDE